MRLGENVLRQLPCKRTMYRKGKEFLKTASVLEVIKILKPYVITKMRYQNTRLTVQQNFLKVCPHDNYRSTSYSKHFPLSGKHEGGTAGGFKNRLLIDFLI